ncbi:integrase [Thermococcus sp.]|uniref:integrase n=1 Tax=Thermococcus sp. TaxID=35749 RepID=UPI002608E9C0|nr:integrase [Thermococcus sp.]
MNPGHRLGRALNLNELWNLHQRQFSEWLSGQVSNSTAKDYLSVLNRFFGRYKISSFEDLRKALNAENYKRNLAKALRNFVKYLYLHDVISFELYEKFKAIIKIKKAGASRTFITDEELREAYGYFKKHGRREELILFKLLLFSGLRLTHAIKVLNEFDRKKLTVLGNIAKYELFTHEGTKLAYYAYMPKELAEELFKSDYSYDMAKKYLRYGRVTAKSIRKWFATFLIKQNVPPSVINYIQGRVPQKVLDAYYAELENLADEAYSRVVDELKKVLEGSE